ncbi:MAG: PP2C family protein-serine/threonine phosphatase [Pseudomonadota bacterium]|nr:PP2C family protein-serine/threonine phosphatase [Pseudomonadota bacterium]
MYRIKCGEILGGNSNQVADACSANLMASLFSSACGSSKGGDIYYLSVCESDIITRMAIADVAGHGEAVSYISNGIYQSLQKHMNSPEGDQVLTSVNHYAITKGVTAITTASVISHNAALKTLFYTTAGHHPTLVKMSGTTRWVAAVGEYSTRQDTVNIPLAVLPEAEYRQFRLPIDTGDRVLLYTDGVTELRNADGSEFGIEGLLQVLDKYNHMALQDLKKSIVHELYTFSNGKLDHDDITIILAEVTEKLPCH